MVKKNSKYVRFECSGCDGDGWFTSWEGDNKKTGHENLELVDCSYCKAKGYVLIEVIDKRVVTRKKKARYEKRY